MMPMAASVSMSLMLPESMNSFMASPYLVFNRVGQFADAFDLDGDGIPRGQRPDPLGRAGRDDVAGFERHHERDELNQVIDRKDQVLRARPLAALPVDPSFDHPRSRPEARGDARPNRCEGVEPFAARVLRFPFLQIPRR